MRLIERRIKYAGDVLSALQHKAEWDIDTACAFLEEIPDVKPIDLVHDAGGCYCWECRSYNKPRLGFCEVHLDKENPDDFCSYGRRREDKND